ncbi:MAG: hypothetical protein J2P49_08910, partial [Methylocapsa sp.]|nr:hypothetical protein [Methylocapsa sp.]
MMPHFARAAFDAIRMQKSGPAFFEVCDPILLASESRGTQIAALYRKLANPALRLALSRAGLPQLSDPALAGAIRGAIIAARDAISPDWVALAKPIAQLLDACPQPARERPPVAGLARLPPLRAIEEVIRACAAHLLECFARRGFIPGYAAFDLMGDPGFRGQELLTAMAALEARSYRNATLLFNLLRVFLLANPAAAALVSPPWTGSSQRLSSPVQIRHRSAYYDAFFSEALTDYLRSGLATPRETAAARKAIATMMDFCLKTSGERVRAPGGGEPVTAITALVSPPDVRMTRFFWQLKHELGFGAYIPDCDTTACAISAATRCGFEEPPLNYPFVDLFAARQTGADGAQRPTLTINDHIAYDGAILTWIENLAGELPFGNDIDPTLNLDVLEV